MDKIEISVPKFVLVTSGSGKQRGLTNNGKVFGFRGMVYDNIYTKELEDVNSVYPDTIIHSKVIDLEKLHDIFGDALKGYRVASFFPAESRTFGYSCCGSREYDDQYVVWNSDSLEEAERINFGRDRIFGFGVNVEKMNKFCEEYQVKKMKKKKVDDFMGLSKDEQAKKLEELL